MRKLGYDVDLTQFRKIKQSIVPVIFTKHQFELIEKRFTNKKMTSSEKNEFSRTISRKMKAINAMVEKETENVFVYGGEKILPARLDQAKKLLKKLSRKFKNKQVFITGSFLYAQKYNDIDIFVITKYQKDDYKKGKHHINYLSKDVYSSLFFASAQKVCVSNKKIKKQDITEKIGLDTLTSLYQELFQDLTKDFKGVKKSARDFLLQAAVLSRSEIPSSPQLKEQTDVLLSIKKPKELVKKIFVQAVVMSTTQRKALKEMKELIRSYDDVIKEYPKHKKYYEDIVSAFKEVIGIAS